MHTTTGGPLLMKILIDMHDHHLECWCYVKKSWSNSVGTFHFLGRGRDDFRKKKTNSREYRHFVFISLSNLQCDARQHDLVQWGLRQTGLGAANPSKVFSSRPPSSNHTVPEPRPQSPNTRGFSDGQKINKKEVRKTRTDKARRHSLLSSASPCDSDSPPPSTSHHKSPSPDPAPTTARRSNPPIAPRTSPESAAAFAAELALRLREAACLGSRT
jgi:hypothetical protein